MKATVVGTLTHLLGFNHTFLVDFVCLTPEVLPFPGGETRHLEHARQGPFRWATFLVPVCLFVYLFGDGSGF